MGVVVKGSEEKKNVSFRQANMVDIYIYIYIYIYIWQKSKKNHIGAKFIQATKFTRI